MSFSQFSAYFDPDDLKLLSRAFNAAWDEAHQSSTIRDADDARQLLAAGIFQAFSEGERDLAALRSAALHRLSNS